MLHIFAQLGCSLKKAWRQLGADSLIETRLYPPLELPVKFRVYRPEDRTACLALHDVNAPGRFPVDSSDQFAKYLDEGPSSLLVTELDSQIVGCGGITLQANSEATLRYGLVTPDLQRQRIGTTLILLCLSLLPESEAPCHRVHIFTVE